MSQKPILPRCVGWDSLTLHGKFRQYQVDVAKGDSLNHYSLGDVDRDGETGSTQLPLPEGSVRDGIEYPTFWSRLPLSIQPNNRDQRRGLYSIHAMGTSLIFPLSQKNLEVRQENNMRSCTAGVYLAIKKNPSGFTLEFTANSTSREFEPFAESARKPILIYGTSITQGDGDNGLRPGATYAAQIMWACQREVINLGVAGSAQIEYKMADFLVQIESEVFILDPGWNLTATSPDALNCTANGAPANITNEEVVARIKYLVQAYRQQHPETPIIICPKFLKEGDGDVNGGKSALPPQGISLPDDWKNPEGYLYSREGFLLLKAYLELVAAGVKKLYWAEQGVTAENGNWLGQGLTAANLHPPVGGMTSIANFVLQAVAQAAPQVYNGKKLSIPVV